MKRIIRLTESDLINLVKRVINEDDNEKKKLIELLKSDDISNVRVGLQLYKTLGIKIPNKTLKNAKERLIPFMIDEYEWDFDIIKDIINDIFVDDPEDLEEDDYIDAIIEWIIDNDFDVEEWFEEVNNSYR